MGHGAIEEEKCQRTTEDWLCLSERQPSKKYIANPEPYFVMVVREVILGCTKFYPSIPTGNLSATRLISKPSVNTSWAFVRSVHPSSLIASRPMITVNTNANRDAMIPSSNQTSSWPLVKSRSLGPSLRADEQLQLPEKFLASGDKKEVLRDCDLEDGDTQSCSSDDASIYIEEDSSEGDEDYDDDDDVENVFGLDSMLNRYLSIELQPKGDGIAGSDVLFDNEQQRRVRFAEDFVTGDVKVVEYDDPHGHSDCENVTRWYTTLDFQQFRRENQKGVVAARHFLFVDDFTNVYDSCASSEKWRALTRAQTMAMSASDHRGLESTLLRGTLLLERKAVVAQILKTQQQHRSLFDLWTTHERAEALAVQARFLATKARRLALVLGAGDALVVASFRTADAAASRTTVQLLPARSPKSPQRRNTRPAQRQPPSTQTTMPSSMFEV
jgi:hypothetical protein